MWNSLLFIGALLLVSVSAQHVLVTTHPYPFNGETNITLELYTRRNIVIPQRITLKDDFAYPNFNPSHKTRFVIRGWRSKGSDFFDDFRATYIGNNEEINVIIVDRGFAASKAASKDSSARMYFQQVGEYLAQVIQHMVKKKNLDLDNVFVIGHSLGAQVAGVAGNRQNGKIGRIVGLDPACPQFSSNGLRDRLDKTDAVFVVVIHTSGGWYGWLHSLGHVDFYPNGGSVQPGCRGGDIAECSHIRALPLYIETIKPTTGDGSHFTGKKCKTYFKFKSGQCKSNPSSWMGEFTPTSASGDYYLETNSYYPFLS